MSSELAERLEPYLSQRKTALVPPNDGKKPEGSLARDDKEINTALIQLLVQHARDRVDEVAQQKQNAAKAA